VSVESFTSVDEKFDAVDSCKRYFVAPVDEFQSSVGLSETLVALSKGDDSAGADGIVVKFGPLYHVELELSFTLQ
jgi:hypothetical protein